MTAVLLTLYAPLSTLHSPQFLRLDGFWPLWLMGAVLAVSLASMALSYGRNRRLALTARLGLFALRVLALLVIMLCIAKPVRVYSESLVEKGLVFIAVDRSSSMNFRDGPNGQSRREQVRAFLTRHADQIDALRRRFTLRMISFAGESREGRIDGEADGKTTALAAPLAAVLSQSAFKIAGVLLISDGRSNAGADPVALAARLRGRAIPVYALQVGTEATPAELRDLRVRRFDVPEKVHVRTPMRMRAELVSLVGEPRQIQVRLRINRELVAAKTLPVEAGRQMHEVDFVYTPQAVGVHRATIEIEPIAGESNQANNRMRAFFRVVESKLHVWYLEGHVRWEQKFLRRTLDGAPNLAVTTVLARPGRVMTATDRLLPTTDADWAALHLVILGDIEADRLTREQHERIRAFVEGGGGLLMIAGPANLGPGGYAATPVGEALPVLITPRDRWITEPLDARPTEEGRRHPVTRLDPDPIDSLRSWRELAELRGVAAVARIKPAARVLLTAGADRPLLAVHHYGKGRAAAFLSDGTWRWVFAERSRETAHRRFWRQMVVWLTRSDYRQNDRIVWADTNRKRYREGDEIILTAQVAETDATTDPRAPAEVLARITGPAGEQPPQQIGRGPGQHHLRYRAERPGDYQVTVQVVTPGGKVLGSDEESRYLVEQVDLEGDNPAADGALLRRIAAVSGGLRLPIARGGVALEALLGRDARTEKQIERVEELWNRPIWLILFAVLLTVEWLLRRRAGLV